MIKEQDLSLRDLYAESRTLLAIERTLLAYLRTTLSLVVAGLAFIKFFGNLPYQWTGYGLIAMGMIVLYYGIKRVFKIKESISSYRFF